MTDKTTIETKRYEGLHVAVIMDGNGRWATRRGLPRISGHRAGVMAVRRIVERAVTIGIGRLTLYAFSSDNWRRPSSEVQGIFRLLRVFLRMEVERLRQHDVRFQVIGRRDRLPKAVLREIEVVESKTLQGRGLRLCVAIDYSSRDAITAAAAEAACAFQSHKLPLPDLVRTIFAQALTAEGGEVDLLIRTGGEKRLSDFLLWESAYAELIFTDRMWPEFEERDFEMALEEFSRRERRFGAVPTPGSAIAAGMA
ncbi:MAG TPA: di-trans,poly-cis-decaprenylcistransferase [Bryobacteraceae bacterium]|nr:di-trans,poly-cis-decaprenylcistransferase [Bryobacteraceae bacterium]